MPLLSDNDVNLDNDALNVCFNPQVPPPLLILADKLGSRHTRGSARTTNARGRSTRGLTSEPVPSAIMTAPQM